MYCWVCWFLTYWGLCVKNLSRFFSSLFLFLCIFVTVKDCFDRLVLKDCVRLVGVYACVRFYECGGIWEYRYMMSICVYLCVWGIDILRHWLIKSSLYNPNIINNFSTFFLTKDKIFFLVLYYKQPCKPQCLNVVILKKNLRKGCKTPKLGKLGLILRKSI